MALRVLGAEIAMHHRTVLVVPWSIYRTVAESWEADALFLPEVAYF